MNATSDSMSTRNPSPATEGLGAIPTPLTSEFSRQVRKARQGQPMRKGNVEIGESSSASGFTIRDLLASFANLARNPLSPIRVARTELGIPTAFDSLLRLLPSCGETESGAGADAYGNADPLWAGTGGYGYRFDSSDARLPTMQKTNKADGTDAALVNV